MKKQNRRSLIHKKERHSHSAQALLDSFHWEWEEKVLLELAATGEFTVEEIRKFRWNQFRLGYNCVIVVNKEMDLSDEVVAGLEECINEKKALDGEPWEAPEDEVFSHSVGKVVHKEILSYSD